jgi:hypothetical protein
MHTAPEHLDLCIEMMRRHPQDSVVRYSINSGAWQEGRGEEFLPLWDAPFAGTLEIDWVVIGPGVHLDA